MELIQFKPAKNLALFYLALWTSIFTEEKLSCFNQTLRLCVLSTVRYKSVLVGRKNYGRFLILLYLAQHCYHSKIFKLLLFNNSSKREIGSCFRELSERLTNHVSQVMGKMLRTEYSKANSFHRATLIPAPSVGTAKHTQPPVAQVTGGAGVCSQRLGQGPGSDLWWEELVTRGFPVEMRNTGTCRHESPHPTAGEEERGCPSWGDSPSFTDWVRNGTTRPGSPARNEISGIWSKIRLLWDHRWVLRFISFQWPESWVTMQNLAGTRKILL